MISDTLSDSAEDIRRYMREFPQYYAQQRARLLVLLELMDHIRSELDAPPAEGRAPAHNDNSEKA